MTDDRAPLLARTAELAAGYLDSLATRPVGGAGRPRGAAGRARRAAAGRTVATRLAVVEALAAAADAGLVATRRSALLRVRHRRQPAGRPRRGLAGERRGTRTPACTSCRRRPPSPRRSPPAGWSSCSGCPPETSVGFVTGATMANFTALAAARHGVLAAVGWDVERHGSPGRAAGHGHHPRGDPRDGLRLAPDARASAARASASGGSRPTTRAGCGPTPCAPSSPRSTARSSSAPRPAT